jgi:hypothetical protein
LTFLATGFMCFRLPRIAIATEPVTAQEKAELSSIGIALAGSAMGVMRGIVGFLSFLLAFELRGGKKGLDLREPGSAAGAAAALARKANIVGNPGAPKWHFGAVLIVAGVGGLVGSRIAPALRTRWLEERILQGALVMVMMAALFAAWSRGLTGTLVLTAAIGTGAAAGKLAFDSLIQRDAPDANWGRSFARFEMRFQIGWVIGALVPTLLHFPERLGFVVIAIAAASAIATYFIGLRSASGVSLLQRAHAMTRQRRTRPRTAPVDNSTTVAPVVWPSAPPDSTAVGYIDPTAVAPVAPAPHDTAPHDTVPTPVVAPPTRRWGPRRPPRRARRTPPSPDDQLELFD